MKILIIQFGLVLGGYKVDRKNKIENLIYGV